jgi:formylmethanofuran dehydrogenase subunit C
MVLRVHAQPPCYVDTAPLLPGLLAGRSREEILRLPLAGWNESFAVGDLFRLGGEDAADLVLEGVNGAFVRIGADLDGGALTVVGDAGDYAGESMRGGTLSVKGNAGNFLGAGMRGGTLNVSGNAGAFVGSARAGETHGMAGGSLVVRGSVGDRAGDRMRRGLLLIEGNAGHYCASRMLAGTMAVLGRVGPYPGYLMRRGSLLLQAPDAALPPTFNHNGRHDLLAIRLLLEELAAYGAAFRRFAKRAPFERWLGDLGCEGKGEVLISRDSCQTP